MKDRRSGSDRRNWTTRLNLVRQYKGLRKRGTLDTQDLARELRISRDVVDRMNVEMHEDAGY